MPRLFTGIAIPDDISEDLFGISEPLAGATWTDPDGYHITLRFAGDIEKRTARDFADALANIDADVFSLRIEGIGVFGGNDPRTLWAGVSVSEPLEQLARAHERAARSAGLPPEPRPFKAHVTLARLKHVHIAGLARLLERYALFRSRSFLVEEFSLYSSRPQTGGGPYVVGDTFDLKGAHLARLARDTGD